MKPPKIGFDYRRYPAEPTNAFPKRTGIYLPVIDIQLVHAEKSVNCSALLDTGADVCLFHSDFAEILGIETRNERDMPITGIGENQIKAYFHTIIINAGGYNLECDIGFSDGVPMNLLGRESFLNRFNVSFEYSKKRILFEFLEFPHH